MASGGAQGFGGPGGFGGPLAQTRNHPRQRHDQLHREHELFLQAFEKPTQIYRFLRTRNMLSPIYLNRTLSYMKQRMSRNHKSRDGFKVDCLLERVTKKNRIEETPNCMGSYMTLTFLGYHDKKLDSPQDYKVTVETLLVKICHKKRKDSSSAIVEVSVGSASVPLNPSVTEPPPMASAVSISSEAFSPSQGTDVKSYMLLLRVNVMKNQNSNGKSIEMKNGDAEEPPHKRTKPEDEYRLLRSELIVYDKHNRCILQGGEYELVLYDVSPSVPMIRSPHKALTSHWETLSEDLNIVSDNNPFDIFNIKPTLKLRLSWSQEPSNGLVTRPRPLPSRIDDQSNADNGNSNKENNRPRDSIDLKTLSKVNHSSNSNSRSENLQIIYQFIYNNNSRQQTEACEDLHCPWCSLDCGRLYALLKHLKLCHSRFSFTYFPIPKGARIDVSINDLYDGSYAGSPHEACGVSGSGNSGGGPLRRTPLTHILVCRPFSRRPLKHQASNNLAEFLESDDNELNDSQRPYITGHNRLYHHTITCLPVYPKELEMDSEEETDPLWLQQKTMMMIDEFTDVNEGEKELMKMWNLHVMKYNFVGDCQIPIACQMFLQLRGRELLEKNLYRNFILHMCSLHDFGLVTSIVFYQTVQILIQMLSDSNAAKQKMKENILQQRENWKNIGMHLQPTVLDQKQTQSSNKTANFGGDSTPTVRRKTSSIQSSTRTASSNYGMLSPNDTKKKAEPSTPTTSGSFEPPQRRKNVQVSNAASSTNIKNSEPPMRRKSACTNGSSSMIASHGRKRLSLHDRKNSM